MENQYNWHCQPLKEVIQQLDTDPDSGLTEQAVLQKQQQFGPNAISKHQGVGPIKRFLLQFHQPLVYILLSAVVITVLLQEWADAAVIFAVVIINAVIGFVQESKALNAINALSEQVQSRSTVIRDGKKTTIPSEQLVPGDIVKLQAGDKVTADIRLCELRDLQIDESALTGESVAVEKNTEILQKSCLLGDRRNMAYSSTLVVYGTGKGVVTNTGDATEIGKISSLIANTALIDTPLTKRIKHFSHLLLWAIIALALVTLLVGYLHGQSILDSFMAAVALSVGAIPEGLPAAVTIMLAIGVSRMARRKAVIRNLPAVETLGSTTVICSDKTGTLTKNEMTVEHIFCAGQIFILSGNGYDPEGEILHNSQATDLSEFPALQAILTTGALCNDSELIEPDNTQPHWHIVGDPTEAALLVAAKKAKLGQAGLAATRIDTIPFQSEYQYMATLNRSEGGDIIHLKGSIESILPRCSHTLNSKGEQVALEHEQIKLQAESFASKGLRVLAFASKALSQSTQRIEHADVAQDMLFLGLQAMIDPPRPEAITAVAACHKAGIKVKMITGDHALTATSIARQLGIIGPDKTDTTVTGYQLNELQEQDFISISKENDVFARVSPEHKLQLVKSLQQQGHVVAMTGDGVNDAPALRRADIGVAMAMNGTEVARDAADMMLTDDNFATVQAAVEEGRGVYDNLKKFIVWTLPTNGGEGLVVLLAVMLGVALPLLPIHILWVNMTTAILLGLMLAFEPKEAGIMARPPHDPKAAILDSVLLWRIVLVSSLLCISAFGLYELESYKGATEAEARTVAVAMFVVGEAFYLFNCRSLDRSVLSVGIFSNPWIWIGIGLMMLLQLLFTYHPIMNDWFQSAPISLGSWLMVILCGWGISLVVGLEKYLRLRINDNAISQIPAKS